MWGIVDGSGAASDYSPNKSPTNQLHLQEVDDDDYTPLMNLSPSKQEVGSGQDQIKHVTWDIFGQEIITLSDQNGAKSWTWR